MGITMTAAMGLGLAALGRPGYINLGHADDLGRRYSISAMRDHAASVLDVAWDLGIRYFDVARSYGRAEEFLGTWLRQRGVLESEVRVGSKWGYTYTAGWKVQTADGVAHEVKRHDLPVLQAQYSASFSQLGTQLDLYQIHSATLESEVLDNQDVLDCLGLLRNTGVRIGLSVTGVGQRETIERAIEITFDGEPLFGAVQATWNLLERSAAPALKAASSAGLEVIVKESLANGRLTTRNAEHNFQPQLERLNRIAAERQTTVDALSIAAALNQPWATTVLSGAANTEHLRSNVAAADVEWDDSWASELDSLVEPPGEYWQTRSQLKWN
jgi:aryl-alcohol dehydrogenase-like predicted oxidoreductase